MELKLEFESEIPQLFALKTSKIAPGNLLNVAGWTDLD